MFPFARLAPGERLGLEAREVLVEFVARGAVAGESHWIVAVAMELPVRDRQGAGSNILPYRASSFTSWGSSWRRRVAARFAARVHVLVADLEAGALGA
jgi:hypothetical protein